MARASEERKNSFVMYRVWGTTLDMLSRKQVGDILMAIYAYLDGEDIDEFTKTYNPKVMKVLRTMLEQIELDRAKYEQTCRNRSIQAKKYRNYVKALEKASNGQVSREEYEMDESSSEDGTEYVKEEDPGGNYQIDEVRESDCPTSESTGGALPFN